VVAYESAARLAHVLPDATPIFGGEPCKALLASPFRPRLGVRCCWSHFRRILVMAKRPGKQIAEATAEPSAKGEAAEKIVKGNAEALTVSGNASRAAIQELTRAYQELATKNAKNLTAAMQALAAVKSPAEFIELQQQLIKEGVEAAVSDSRHIAQLTTAVFTAAFEPVKKQLEKTAQT
jgi:phasin family protein